MNVYLHDVRQGDWKLIPVTDATQIGFKKQQNLTVGKRLASVSAQLIPFRDLQGRLKCVLIPSPGVDLKINGLRAFSLHVLRDRDEISHRGQRLYFTYEVPPQVVSLPSELAMGTIYCARCKGFIESEAVKCPGSCGLWYHESKRQERLCWSYDAKCLVCGHPTARGLSWRPAPKSKPVKLTRVKNAKKKSVSVRPN